MQTTRGESYLREFLAPRFGLTRPGLVTASRRGQVWRARSSGERLIVKIYDARLAPIARRTAALHDRLSGTGVRTARLVGHDLGLAAASERRQVALIFAWEGPSPRMRGRVAAARALENLACIHRVEPPVLAGLELEGISVEGGQRLEIAGLPAAEEPFLGDLEIFCERMRGSSYRVAPTELARIDDWCKAAARRLDAAPVPDSLLHGDYRASNLVKGSAGLVTIDLDEALAGPFHRELGLALVRCLWGTTSRALDRIEPRAWLDDTHLGYAEAAYLDEATPAVRQFWHAHRETVLLAAYLRMIGRLSSRSAADYLYGRRARARYRRQARRRFLRMARHIADG